MSAFLIFQVLFTISLNFYSEKFESKGNYLKITDIESNYDQLYVYRNKLRTVEQKVYVKYTSKEKITYKIILTKEKCNTSFSGEAKMRSEGDAEIDEDEEGNAFVVNEFIAETELYYLSIRISEDKAKSKITYAQTKGEEPACPLVTNEIIYSE